MRWEDPYSRITPSYMKVFRAIVSTERPHCAADIGEPPHDYQVQKSQLDPSPTASESSEVV